MPRRKYLKHPDLVKIAAEGYGPVFADALGRDEQYAEVWQRYRKMLYLFSPPVEHVEYAGDPAAPLVPDVGWYPSGSLPSFHLMTAEQRQAVDEFYQAVGIAIQTAYNRGLNHGQDLLSQLARGEISIGDFEKPHKRCPHCHTAIPTGNRNCSNCRHEVE